MTEHQKYMRTIRYVCWLARLLSENGLWTRERALELIVEQIRCDVTRQLKEWPE